MMIGCLYIALTLLISITPVLNEDEVKKTHLRFFIFSVPLSVHELILLIFRDTNNALFNKIYSQQSYNS